MRRSRSGQDRRSRVVALVVAASVAAASVATIAGAQPRPKGPGVGQAPADVETAEQLYAKLDYEQANATAERIVKQRGLAHDQLVRAYRVLAVTSAILGKEEEAQNAFFQLLVFDPEYAADPNLGPKVNNPFVEARGKFRALAQKPGIEITAQVRSDGGQLRVTTRDPTHLVRSVRVGYRWTSLGEYSVSQIAVGDPTAVEVSGAPSGRTRLDFYAQAVDERDNAVFEAGNAQVPKSAFAESGGGGGGGKGGGSIFSSPLFWIFAGAAVAGGGTALFFALRPQDPPSKAQLSPVIVCGTEVCK